MNIKVYDWKNDDYKSFHRLYIDEKEELSISDLSGDCPEDAIIGRSLVDAHDVIEYMKKAHEAGKRGEPLNIEILKEADPNW